MGCCSACTAPADNTDVAEGQVPKFEVHLASFSTMSSVVTVQLERRIGEQRHRSARAPPGPLTVQEAPQHGEKATPGAPGATAASTSELHPPPDTQLQGRRRRLLRRAGDGCDVAAAAAATTSTIVSSPARRRRPRAAPEKPPAEIDPPRNSPGRCAKAAAPLVQGQHRARSVAPVVRSRGRLLAPALPPRPLRQKTCWRSASDSSSSSSSSSGSAAGGAPAARRRRFGAGAPRPWTRRRVRPHARTWSSPPRSPPARAAAVHLRGRRRLRAAAARCASRARAGVGIAHERGADIVDELHVGRERSEALEQQGRLQLGDVVEERALPFLAEKRTWRVPERSKPSVVVERRQRAH